MRVEPDEKFIEALDRELQIFNYFIERVMEKIRVTTEMPGPAGRVGVEGGAASQFGNRPVTPTPPERNSFGLAAMTQSTVRCS